MRLSQLAAALADRFGQVQAASPDSGRRNAAVAVLLRPPDGATDPVRAPVRSCRVLAIRRADPSGDPWSGQMALPGGRLDKADAGLVAAAIRETREETGIDLAAGAALLGRTGAMRPLGVRVPAISIWPFVFRVAPTPSHGWPATRWRRSTGSRWRHSSDPANRGTYSWSYGGIVRPFPCIRLEDRVIWGLTYRILTELFDLAANGG